MKVMNCVVILLSALVLTGCSSFSSSDDEEILGARVINYQEVEGEIADLIIPPDLTNPSRKATLPLLLAVFLIQILPACSWPTLLMLKFSAMPTVDGCWLIKHQVKFGL